MMGKLLIEKNNLFKFSILNQINFLFSYLVHKSKLEELKYHKVVTIMSYKFELIFLSIWFININ